MADYSLTRKSDPRSAYPENAVEAHEWSLYQPLITPKQLRDKQLALLPLISNVKDPLTGKYAVMTDDQLKEQILDAAANVSLEAGIDIFPVQREEKVPFDRQEMLDLGYMRTKYKPIRSVEKLSVAPGDQPDLLIISPEWISKEGFTKGEVRIVPTVGSLVGQGALIGLQAGSTGFNPMFATILNQSRWVASFWNIIYTTGFNEGLVPRPLNDLIGSTAAIEVLSLLAATNRSASHSLSIDGMSQSVSTPGPQVYKERIDQLERKREMLMKRFRAKFGNKFAIGNI
jgi:hypothetical protein